MSGKTGRMSLPYVDEFLDERSQDEGYPAAASTLLRLLVGQYQEAVNERNWPKSKALGQVMLKAVEQFKDHPDYAQEWAAP